MSGGSDVPDTDLIACRSCGTLVVMATHCKTGKVAPITAAVATDGNVLTWRDPRGRPVYEIVPAAKRGLYSSLRRSHFADCPEAVRYRRR